MNLESCTITISSSLLACFIHWCRKKERMLLFGRRKASGLNYCEGMTPKLALLSSYRDGASAQATESSGKAQVSDSWLKMVWLPQTKLKWAISLNW